MKNSNEAPEPDSKDSGVLSNPLSFLRSGRFYWRDASLDTRGGSGNYWLRRSRDTTNSNFLYFAYVYPYLYPQGYDARAFGFAVRCVQILHHSH